MVVKKKSLVDTIFSVLHFHFLEVGVSTKIDVPNKSTIPTGEWVSSVSKARKSTSHGEITSNFLVLVNLFILIVDHYFGSIYILRF